MAKLPGAYEYMATVGAPAINFTRGLLGYQDPFLTQTMQDRMAEIEGERTQGNVGYNEYGLVPSAGRFTGGLMDLAINRPADFALAGSIGKYDFGPEGRKGLEYNFTPDQDTGSTGSAMLDFINRGGVKGALSRMGTAQAAEVTPTRSLGDVVNESIMVEDLTNPNTRNFLISAANALPNQSGIINALPNIMSPGVRTIENQAMRNFDQPYNMRDVAGESLPFNIDNLGNPNNDPRVVSEELGMTGFGRPTMADIAGMEIDENLIDRGNPTGDFRVVSEEQGLSGFPGLGQVDRGFQDVLDAREARRGQIEMQQNPDYGQFFDAAPLNEQKRGINLSLLGMLAGPAGFLTGSNALKGIGMLSNIASGRTGRAFDAVSKGVGSLGSKFAGKMRGTNPVTGKANTQAQYEQNRANRQRNNRIDNMLERKAAGKSYSQKNLNELTMGSRPGQYDKPGGDTGGGGRSKIVCTMMNDSYGFGNFRNKIWLKHSRDLPKEYEVGYHTIFLPLVKFAKGEGKLNKVVKKTLEHIAKHRTYDLKQEMKGKTHLLGRAYRKVLEPICYIVGKASMFTRRG